MAGLPQPWRKPRDTYCEASVTLAVKGDAAGAAATGAVTGGGAPSASAGAVSACAATAGNSSRAQLKRAQIRRSTNLRNIKVSSDGPCLWRALGLCRYVRDAGSRLRPWQVMDNSGMKRWLGSGVHE